MSSDRENFTAKNKAEQRDCLAILAEVEQYILQGKRDPKKVAEYVQKVIGPIGKLLFVENTKNNERDLTESLKRQTVAGKIKWELSDDIYAAVLNRGDCLIYNDSEVTYNLHMRGYGGFAIYDNKDARAPIYVFDLTNEDRVFFKIIFDELKNNKAESLPEA